MLSALFRPIGPRIATVACTKVKKHLWAIPTRVTIYFQKRNFV